jgi:hypothetical protein
MQKPGPDEGRLMVVAMQIAGTPDEGPMKLTCKPVDEVGACFAYSATYDTGGNRPLPILVLTAK